MLRSRRPRAPLSPPAVLGTALLLTLALLLAGCSRGEAHWRLKDVTGLLPDLQFQLREAGHSVDARDFRGKITLVYFGYTHCPDVCPTTLAQLRTALGRLGAASDAVRVLFVTVDPARDTAGRLQNYVHYFGPQFVGLRGDDAALRRLTKRYRVTYEAGRADARGDYEVAHSSGVFIFDRGGHARLLATPKDSVDAVAADLTRLVAAGEG